MSVCEEKTSQAKRGVLEIIPTIGQKKNGRPSKIWKQFKTAYPEFAAKPLTYKLDALKNLSSDIAYLRGAEIFEAAYSRKKADYATVQTFGICVDKLLKSDGSDDFTLKIPARMLGSYSAALVLRPTEKALSLNESPPTT